MNYTRFEKARIIGARALQISMGAPPLTAVNSMDPLELAFLEFSAFILPLTPRRSA